MEPAITASPWIRRCCRASGIARTLCQLLVKSGRSAQAPITSAPTPKADIRCSNFHCHGQSGNNSRDRPGPDVETFRTGPATAGAFSAGVRHHGYFGGENVNLFFSCDKTPTLPRLARGFLYSSPRNRIASHRAATPDSPVSFITVCTTR